MKQNNPLGRSVVCVVTLVLLAGCHYQGAIISGGFPSPQLNLTLNNDARGGTWRWEGDPAAAARRGTWVNVQVKDTTGSWVSGFGLRPEDFRSAFHVEGLPPSGAVNGTIRRGAGQFTFSGEGEAGGASGTFQFEPDSDYVREVPALLTRPPSAREWVLLALHDVTLASLREIKSAAYTLSAADVLRLRHNGVSVDYLVALRKGGCDFDIDDIIKLRHAGVQSEFPVGLRKAGFALSAAELVSLRHSGATLDYVLALKKADAGLPTEQIVKLRHAGVQADFFSDLRQIQPALSGNEIIKLRHAGVSADFGKQWSAFDVSWEDVIKLRHAGLSADYATELKNAGYALTPDQIIKLRNAGVPVDYFGAVKKAGYDFTWEELIKLRQAGVSADYLAALHTPGKKNLGADVIIDLRRRGVPVETVKRIRSNGE